MAQPTKEQIDALEKAQKDQLGNLIQAGRFRIALAKQFGINSDQFKDYNAIFVPLVNSWAIRQVKLHAAGAPIFPSFPNKILSLSDFTTQVGITDIENKIKELDKEGKGIGFVPLLIWAAILIAGLFTAQQIVDETNTTTQEQAALMKQTQDFCTKYNLPIEECKKILSQNIEATGDKGGLFSDFVPVATGLGIAYLVFSNWDKITGSTKTK